MKLSGGRRPPAVAGQFYPGSPEVLQSSVFEYLPAPPPRVEASRVRAVIVPHAGYQYSGPAAGKAFGAIRDDERIRRAVVIAPSHRVGFTGLSVGDYSSFGTPLGDLLVDTEACRQLARGCDLVSTRRDAHADEHSLEVQLPFLQTALGPVELVPIVCGDMSLLEIRRAAQAIAEHLWRADTLWVISSDFTHYGYAFGYVPFNRDVPQRLEELDGGAIERIRDVDLEGFLDYVAETGATICGRIPIALLLAVLEAERERWKIELCEYTTSGKLTHDVDHSVSYASFAVIDRGCADSATATEECEMLSDVDKRFLLSLARESIRTHLTNEALDVPPRDELTEIMLAERATFVSLHRHGQLRGCIGSLEPIEALYENVIGNARNAAFQDPRFPPLELGELDDTEIEISVLTPPVPIAVPEEFEVGRHGIILEKGYRRAVFLPQVAPAQGWDRETTLDHLALKAGLRPGEWRRDTSFSVFEAIVFGENEPAGFRD